MSFDEETSLPGMGHNLPDYGKEIADQIASDYEADLATAVALLEEARELYKTQPIADDDAEKAGRFAGLFKRIRDHVTLLKSHHAKEKQPHKVRAEAVDSAFFGVIDTLIRRSKTNKPGAGDYLASVYDDWNQRKLRREQIERERIAREAAEEERKKQEAAAEAARKEQEAREAAERARAPAQIEKKQEIADQAAVVADVAKVEAMVATDKADAAALATRAKPADLTRTRFEGGTTGTMGTERYVEIINKDELDLEKLRPHLSISVLETALRGYAGSVDYSEDARFQIKGAKFGKRAKTRIR